MLGFAWQAGRCSISRPNCLWRHSRVSVFNRLRRKKKLSLVAVSGCPWCQGIKNQSLVAVSCCDCCILRRRAGSMRKEATLCTCKLWCFSRDFAAVVANMNSVVPWAVLLLLHVLWLRFGWCMCGWQILAFSSLAPPHPPRLKWDGKFQEWSSGCVPTVKGSNGCGW